MDGAASQDALSALWAMWPDAVPLHVVDVGANPIEGDAPYKALLQRGYCTVTGFEPQAEALAALDAKKSDRETYLPDALGDGRAATLYQYRQSGFTSLFPIRAEAVALLGWRHMTREVAQHPLITRRMDEIDELRQVDFLKIDVQGSELAIISNGSEKLAQAVAVQTEVRFLPLYQGEPAFGDLDAELRRQGFQFHDFAHLKRVAPKSPSQTLLRPRVNRQVVDGDAWYIRDLTNLAAISAAQLFRLAILAEAVLRSPTIALFCLDTLVARGAVATSDMARYTALLPAQMLR